MSNHGGAAKDSVRGLQIRTAGLVAGTGGPSTVAVLALVKAGEARLAAVVAVLALLVIAIVAISGMVANLKETIRQASRDRSRRKAGRSVYRMRDEPRRDAAVKFMKRSQEP